MYKKFSTTIETSKGEQVNVWEDNYGRIHLSVRGFVGKTYSWDTDFLAVETDVFVAHGYDERAYYVRNTEIVKAQNLLRELREQA